ncbi:MAG: CBS domain-containing protein [Thiolinea sp.]
MMGLDIREDWNDIEEQLIHSPFTRMLVYEDSLDIYSGLYSYAQNSSLFQEGRLDRERLLQALRPAYFVPESTSLTQQLINFREESRRIAVVVDEYGEIRGLLTMEDILEEIVGEFSTVRSVTTVKSSCVKTAATGWMAPPQSGKSIAN